MILSPHQTALFLQSRGYEVDKNFKFKIRKDERTPSASIYKDGKIHDFGTGWHGDIVDFMIHFENIPKRNAFAIAKEFSKNHFDFQPSINTYKQTHYNNKPKSPMSPELAIDKFKAYQLDRELNQDRFYKLISKTIHTSYKGLDKNLDSLLGYDAKRDRITMPIINKDGEITNFWAYNPNYTEYKVLFEKDCPRELFNIATIKNNNEMIYIFEGEKDAMNAINLGINAIAVPTSSYTIKDKELELFKERNVCIIFDADEAGQNGAIKLQNQLKSVANSVNIIDIIDLAKNIKKGEIQRGYDFSDYIKDKTSIELQKNRTL